MKYFFQPLILILLLSFSASDSIFGQMGSQISLKAGFIDSPLRLTDFNAGFPAISINGETGLTDYNLWDDPFSSEADLTFGSYKYEDDDFLGNLRVNVLSVTAGANFYPFNLGEREKASSSNIKIMPRLGVLVGYDYSFVTSSIIAVPLPRRFFVGAKAGIKIGTNRFAAFIDAGYMPQSIIQVGVGYTIESSVF